VPAAVASAGPTPRRRGAETTEQILSAAVAEIAAEGVDRASLPRIAGRAGLSVGPLYSRFDDTDDLVAALWADRLRDRFDEFLRDAATWITSGDGDAGQRLHSELAGPSPTTVATLEVLATVRRYPYSADAVVADATRSFREFVAAVDPVPQATAGYALAAIVGEVLLHDLLPPSARAEPRALLDVARALTRPTDVEPVTPTLTTIIPMPTITSGGDVPNIFMNAALEVIARGGFEHASANRISRAAGLSASRVYEHFGSMHELAAEALTGIIDFLVGAKALAFVGVDRATYRQMVIAGGRALVDPESVPARRLRLECALAARHHPDIGATAREAFDRAERTVADSFRTLAPGGSDAALRNAQALWHLVRDFGFGVLPLHEAADALAPDVDLAPLASALPQVYEDFVLAPLGR